MKPKLILISALMVCLVLCGLSLSAQTYFVKKVKPGAVSVTGKGKSRVWHRANVLTDFVYPWDSVAAPATSFSALWDGEWLYCLYRVKDSMVVIYADKNEKREIGRSDRVEIFLTPDEKMTPYYCLELDASGRILDYTATYYREMHYEWQWPKGQLIVKTSPTPGGYIVEAAISIQSLRDLGLFRNGRLHAGLFRAENKGLLNGRPDLRWISWIRPQSVKPDFHIPSAFGVLVLE